MKDNKNMSLKIAEEIDSLEDAEVIEKILTLDSEIEPSPKLDNFVLNYAKNHNKLKYTKKHILKWVIPIASAAAIILMFLNSNNYIFIQQNATTKTNQSINKTVENSYDIELGNEELDIEIMELSLEMIFEQDDLEGTDVIPNNSSSTQRKTNNNSIS